MAQIFPFRAYRYDPSRFNLTHVLTQPYDKITPEMQDRYYSLNPDNLIALEKGRSFPDDSSANNVYTRAAQALQGWIDRRVLVRDSVPGIYVYFQDYQVPHSSEKRLRKGFIAVGRVEDYSAGIVFRHEQTLAGPKADRLELLRHTRAHSGQLFMLYDDPARETDALLDQASRVPPPVKLRDDYGVIHRLWPVFDPQSIGLFRRALSDKKLVIADGHHRYETALAYRNECRAAGNNAPDAPHEKVMMTFFNTRSEGLTILPTHRVISGLGAFDFARFRAPLDSVFEVQSFAFSSDSDRAARLAEFRRELLAQNRQRNAIGLYVPGAFHLFLLRPDADLDSLLPGVSPAQRRLDVVLLHGLLLKKGLGITPDAVKKEKNITYEREMDAAIAAVDAGQAQLCFLLNPIRIEQMMEIALGGEVLPQKSTDFYPKLLSGITIYRLDNDSLK